MIRREQSERVRGAAHVLLHQAHAGRLDVETARVERHALADDARSPDRSRLAPADLDVARRLHGALAHGVDHRIAALERLAGGDRDLGAELLRQLLRPAAISTGPRSQGGVLTRSRSQSIASACRLDFLGIDATSAARRRRGFSPALYLREAIGAVSPAERQRLAVHARREFPRAHNRPPAAIPAGSRVRTRPFPRPGRRAPARDCALAPWIEQRLACIAPEAGRIDQHLDPRILPLGPRSKPFAVTSCSGTAEEGGKQGRDAWFPRSLDGSAAALTTSLRRRASRFR